MDAQTNRADSTGRRGPEAEIGETTSLLGTSIEVDRLEEGRRNSNSNGAQQSRHSFICPILCLVGLVSFIIAVIVSYLQTEGVSVTLRVVSLNTWGMPEILGSKDKEARMKAIGEFVAKADFDLYLLEELWLRADHDIIKQHLPQGYYITDYNDMIIATCPGMVLTPFLCCDGVLLPGGCSGLTVISRFPFLSKHFTVYDDHGPMKGGESLARKGFGRVRISPTVNMTVDVYLTHICASGNANTTPSAQDENGVYRERQVAQLLSNVSASTADFVILAGDFNVDPRAPEKTYHELKDKLVSAMEEFFEKIANWLIPKKATYANPRNIYSNMYSPILIDYIWHRSKPGNLMITNLFDVPFLKAVKTTKILKEETGLFYDKTQEINFSDHEAVTASLILVKPPSNAHASYLQLISQRVWTA